MSSNEHKEKIWNFIKDIKVGMLTTQDGNDLRARPMHLVQDEYDGTIWFFTKRSAEKSFEVKDEHNICLSFCDHNDGVHVSLSGHARLTQDRNLIDQFWSPFAGAWFEGGKDDPDVALLEIKIYKGEHWESEDNKVFQLYEIAKANLTDETPNIGENQKFG
jgi:general stress protein 26